MGGRQLQVREAPIGTSPLAILRPQSQLPEPSPFYRGFRRGARRAISSASSIRSRKVP